MVEALASVAACTVALMLLIAFAEHLSAPRSLPGALAAHKTLPQRLARPVAIVVTAAEGLLGLGLVAGVITGTALTGLLAAACVLLATYAGYTYRLLKTERTVPCGCSRADTPVSGWVVLRAGMPSALALPAGLGADAIVTPGESASWFAQAAIAGAVFAVLLWVLPEAMIDPGRAVERGAPRGV